VRWVGNEDGVARQSEWSPLPYDGDPSTAADNVLPIPGGDTGVTDLAGDDVLSQRNSDGTSTWNLLRWAPAECDATLSEQHDWFWHPNDTPRSESELENIYYNSVGHNCNLLLDVPPDSDGRYDQTTANALQTFGDAISQTFGTNLAAGAAAANDSGTSSTAGHGPADAVDGTLDTSWQPTSTTGALVVNLPTTRTFDVVSVREDLNVGQRVESFAVDAWTGSGWNQIAADTTVGNRKLIRFAAPVTTSSVRLRITGARDNPAIAEVGLFLRPASSQSIPGPVLAASGKCVDLSGGNTTNGTVVQLYDCNGTVDQQWTLAADGTLRNQGKCLDLYNGSGNGALLEIWDCNGGWNQQWQIGPNNTLTNPASGRCVDDPAFDTDNGTQLEVWDCNGGSNQQWTVS
jgi:alpha-L-fucosidase